MCTLPQDMTIIIRSYDRHTCGDILSKCRCERFENAIMLNTQKKHIPSTKLHTVSLFVIRDDSTEEDERRYESEVVEINIYSKLKLNCITEDILHQLKRNKSMYSFIFTCS